MTIHPVGTVALTVKDLESARKFYADALGLRVLDAQSGRLRLVADPSSAYALLELVEAPAATRPEKATGLYHIAIRVPSYADLARLLVHLSELGIEIEGTADHLVSAALYLTDPEGNGVELYCDFPADEWPRDKLGRLQMGTSELDLDWLLSELEGESTAWDGIHPETVVGHVHLSVKTLEPEVVFFTRELGLAVTQRYGPAAAFTSFKGYHHHVGLNTWVSAGAPAAPADSIGLRWFALRYPAADLEAALARLQAANIPVEDHPAGKLVRTPSGICVVLQGE